MTVDPSKSNMSSIGNFLVLSIAIALFFTPTSHALNCYQGQQNSTLPVVGSAMACPMGSMSCSKSVDPSMNIATRACQVINCTMNGMISSTAVCQNSTSYPYQTFCCCYGDGCNSAPGSPLSALSFVAAAFTTFAPLSLARYLML